MYSHRGGPTWRRPGVAFQRDSEMIAGVLACHDMFVRQRDNAPDCLGSLDSAQNRPALHGVEDLSRSAHPGQDILCCCAALFEAGCEGSPVIGECVV